MSLPAGLHDDFDALSLALGDTASGIESGSLTQHLLVGLEQQKQELGPIAEELIALLHRLGVAGSA